MQGIAKHAFDGVLAKDRKKECRFDFAQGFILRCGIEEMKTLQTPQTLAVNLPRGGASLVTEFARGIFKGRLRVAKTIAAVSAGELPVNEDGDSRFACARARVIRREDARGRSGDYKSFRFREGTKGNSDRFVLCGQKRSFAVQRINEDPAESCCGKREKMTAAHVRECNRGTETWHLRRKGGRSVL